MLLYIYFSLLLCWNFCRVLCYIRCHNDNVGSSSIFVCQCSSNAWVYPPPPVEFIALTWDGGGHWLIIIIITLKNNNNNNQRQCLWCYPHDHGHCETSPGSFDECRLSAGWPPTLRPSQPTWAVSPPINGYDNQPTALNGYPVSPDRVAPSRMVLFWHRLTAWSQIKGRRTVVVVVVVPVLAIIIFPE